METEINIVEILKDKPQGTKLYSSACGKCKLEEVDDKSFKISFYNSKFGFMNGGEGYLDKNGKLYDDGECVVFPSKEMRDWSKLAWSTGDILVNKDGNAHVIFEAFDDDTYETFNGDNYLWENEGITMFFGEYEDELPTSDFSKANKEDAQKYIRQIEKRLGYKLNFETLKLEKSEFKDGDVVTIMPHIGDKLIYLFKAEDDEKYYGHAFLDGNIAIVNEDSYCQKDFCTARPSTDEEKQQLFSALAKKNMAWDAEKKQFVDLKPKIEFKPFDKVVVRDTEYSTWCADLFSHIDEDYRYACVGATWSFCIPYNEETAKLIGTTNNVEG